MARAFTLVELLVAIIIVGILSSLGAVGFNSYVSSSKDSSTKNNYEAINKISESEFAKCKLNKNSKIFDSHSCNNSSPPTIAQLDNYFTITQKLKNPYDQNQKVIQSDICSAGAIVIKTASTGIYETSYFSQKNNTKNTSSPCSGNNCSYNFSNNTWTAINTGQIYDATTGQKK